jgi:hypothetical protein
VHLLELILWALRLPRWELLEPELSFLEDLAELFFEWADGDEQDGNGEADDDNNGNQGVCVEINSIRKSKQHNPTETLAKSNSGLNESPDFYVTTVKSKMLC